MCACVYYSPVREKLMPLAEELRAAISLPINYPVLIIGDASSSMSVAVRTATIIAGFIASVCPERECNLRFFKQGQGQWHDHQCCWSIRRLHQKRSLSYNHDGY